MEDNTFKNIGSQADKIIQTSDTDVNTDSVVDRLHKEHYPNNSREEVLKAYNDYMSKDMDPSMGFVKRQERETFDRDDLTPGMQKLSDEQRKIEAERSEKMHDDYLKNKELDKMNRQRMAEAEKRSIRDPNGRVLPVPNDFNLGSHVSVNPESNETEFDPKKPYSNEELENLYNFIKENNKNASDYDALFKKWGIPSPLNYLGME